MCCHASALGGRSQGRYRGVRCEKAWLFLCRELFVTTWKPDISALPDFVWK
ncbi:rCG57381 [Rattus norvegicus]|uniref:RCG57381 n=1 Tax=Rattus norvegicus TaxID=10116 RepID=A6JP66_RAT|nr:rCG57381 [Rattus norvegicus]